MNVADGEVEKVDRERERERESIAKKMGRNRRQLAG